MTTPLPTPAKEKIEKMGLPTIEMLESFWEWWLEYKRLVWQGKIVGKYCKDWWLNKNLDEFDLFLRWLLELIQKEKKRRKQYDQT